MGRNVAKEIKLSEKQEKILREITNSRTYGVNLTSRSRIVLEANAGKSNNTIEKEMNITGKKVTRCRNRYNSAQEELNRIEMESPQKLRSAIESVLSDDPRPGAPVTYRDDQVAAILLVACEGPEKYDLPLSHWTPGALTRQVIKMGIVDEISVRQACLPAGR
jgi:hypothetical protein